MVHPEYPQIATSLFLKFISKGSTLANIKNFFIIVILEALLLGKLLLDSIFIAIQSLV